MLKNIPVELFKEHVVTCLTYAEDLCKLKCVNKELSDYIITHPAVLKQPDKKALPIIRQGFWVFG